MTSTLPPDPPNFPGINYNPSFWSNANSTGLTYNQALKNFLAFPVAQGTETLQNTNVNGTLTIINTTTPSETYSQYVDPNPNLDMTLSTTQTTGGLTIKTPTNSFTMNPNSFNINLITPTSVTGLQMLNPINMANFNIVNMGQYSTAYTQALNTHEDYVATCNYVNNMIVNGGGILDNANDWTATNTFESYLNVGTVTASNYYTQISQLANGALNINNQTPTANFPNINFQCNNGSNVMTNYFSITPQKLDSNTSLNMNNQVIYGVNELSFSQTNDLCTIASNLFAPQFIFTNSIAYDINAVPTIVFYLNNTNNVGLNSPLSINTTAVDINNNLFINSGADITLSSGTAIIGNVATPNTISNVNLTSSTATTPQTTDNDTSIATTAYVKNNLNNYATLASPVFSGNPTAPTPLSTDNDTSIATTAFVKANLPIYTTTTISQSLSSCTMTPATQNCTTIQSNLTIVLFTSSIFSLTAVNVLNPPTFAKINFSALPWPLFPPPTGNYFINGVNTATNISYSFPVIFATATTYYMQISLPTGAPYTLGTNYSFNLETIGSISA